MKITIIAVGKPRDKSVDKIVAEYAKRLPPGLSVEWIAAQAASGKLDSKETMAREAEAIRQKMPNRAVVAALWEKGESLDSMSFARWIGKVRDGGQDLCFVIGGADGIDPGFLAEADRNISLSSLTFPHELVRAVLAEQIYRAFSILAGAPYHRE